MAPTPISTKLVKQKGMNVQTTKEKKENGQN